MGFVTFEKLLDIASTRMAIACCAGQSYQMAEIHLCRDTGKKEVFAVYRLGNCIISKIAAAGSGSDATPKETVNVRYREIHWVYRWLNDNGAVIKDDATGWSASKNQELTAGKGYSKDDSASELIPAWSGS